MRRFRLLLALVLSGTLGAAPPAAPEHGIGNVHMAISCGADANARFDRGLALLHNFWYERALTEFDAVIAAHPDCAIAYWGAAMTYNHPLWSPPTGTDVKAALAVSRAGERRRDAQRPRGAVSGGRRRRCSATATRRRKTRETRRIAMR